MFSDFVSKTSARFRSKIGVSPSPKWPIGIAAERSSDMVDKVKAETGTIGYGELQYAIKAGLQHGSVQNPAGKYVRASNETITAACRAVEEPGWSKFSASLTNAPGEDSYPITSFTWFYVRKSGNSQRSAALMDFLTWVFSEGQQIGAQEGYSPLPQQLVEKVRTKIVSLR